VRFAATCFFLFFWPGCLKLPRVHVYTFTSRPMCYLCHCGDYLGHLWRQAGKLMDIFIADWMHEKPSKPTAQTLSWPTFTYISLIEHFRSMKSHNEISFIYIPLSVRIHTYLFVYVCPKCFGQYMFLCLYWMADHFFCWRVLSDQMIHILLAFQFMGQAMGGVHPNSPIDRMKL